jgi:AraC-like DNA-binding protein
MKARSHREPVPLGERPLPAAYVRLVLETLSPQDEERRRRQLRAVGIRDDAVMPGQTTTVPFGRAARLMESISADLPPGWHLALAARLDAAAHGPLGYALLSSETLGDALAALLEYAEIRFPFLWLVQSAARGHCSIECLPSGDLGSLRQPLMELSAISIARLIAQVVGRGNDGLSVVLAGKPPAYSRQLREAAGAEVRHSGDAVAVLFPAAWLGLPGLYADEGMNRLSLGRCRDLRDRICRRSEIEIDLRQELLARRGRAPGLEALARSRHMSSRTLIRRLKRQGTSYRRIVAEVHAGLAADLLRNTSLPVAEIAARLGFADPANFGRAFREWFGASPGRYRDL